MTLNNSVSGSQSEACSPCKILCSEKRLEYSPHGLFVHPYTGVPGSQHDIFAGFGKIWLSNNVLMGDVECLQVQFSASGHCGGIDV